MYPGIEQTFEEDLLVFLAAYSYLTLKSMISPSSSGNIAQSFRAVFGNFNECPGRPGKGLRLYTFRLAFISASALRRFSSLAIFSALALSFLAFASALDFTLSA